MIKKLLQVFILGLLFGSLILPARLTVRAADMTCPTHIPVTVDVKPGGYPNTINLSSMGLVPVAVITTPGFDANQFIPEMALLADANTDMSNGCNGAMAIRWVLADVNGDTNADLVFFFRTQDLNLTAASTAATFMAHGMYAATTVHIMGTDSVKIVP